MTAGRHENFLLSYSRQVQCFSQQVEMKTRFLPKLWKKIGAIRTVVFEKNV